MGNTVQQSYKEVSTLGVLRTFKVVPTQLTTPTPLELICSQSTSLD